jgi:hypothetical protein
MPEAKLLTDKSTNDHQAFSQNYFSLSIGFFITMAVGLIYGLLFRMNQKQGGALQGLKCLIIIAFLTVTSLTFMKPFLHMSSNLEIRTDDESISQKFRALEMFTPSFGLCLGIIGFSTMLSSITCVPELLVNENKKLKKEDQSPYHQYFKLPLVLGNFFAVLFKCAFSIFGAMMLTDDSNLFSGLLFDQNQNEATLIMLGVYCLFIVLP